MAEATPWTFGDLVQSIHSLHLTDSELYTLKRLISVYIPQDQKEELFQHIRTVMEEVFGKERVARYYTNQALFIPARESDEENEPKHESLQTVPENQPEVQDENTCL